MISLGANTIAPVTPVWVVGTFDPAGKPNAMTAAWAGICCSQPPCAYVSLRKATSTYDNIMARKAFTISFPSEDHVKEADYFGIASGHDTDKFKAANLTPVKSDLVDAPYVKEFPLILECRVLKDAGIIRCRKDGTKRLYSIVDQRIFGAVDVLTDELVNVLAKEAFNSAFC